MTGVGLGLSIVDDCVRVMGGMIEVESVEGAGALFIVSLPRSASAQAAAVLTPVAG